MQSSAWCYWDNTQTRLPSLDSYLQPHLGCGCLSATGTGSNGLKDDQGMALLPSIHPLMRMSVLGASNLGSKVLESSKQVELLRT